MTRGPDAFPDAGDWVITKAIAVCVLGGALLVLVLSLAGCVDQAFASTMRDQYRAVAPEFLEYVDADESIGQPAKDQRHRQVKAWDRAITAAGVAPVASEDASE